MLIVMNTAAMPDRRYDLDWLRVIAFAILMLFHTGMGFDSFDWHVKNYESSPLIDEFVRFLHQWRMPLLFFISGAAVFFALNKYGTRRYLAERQLRLLVPLVFGMLVVIPPQVYCERVYQRLGYTSFWDFYPTVFTSGSYPQGNLSWHHLWYIPYIWAFSMVTLPLFLWLKRYPTLLARLEALLARSSILYLIFLPSALAEILLRPYYPGDYSNLFSDWANFSHKLTFFVLGYALASRTALSDAIASRRHHYCTAALLALVPLELIWHDHLHLSPNLYRCLSNFHIWMWVLTALGFGRRYLNFNRPALKYCTNAVYPFYILHQTVIIMLLLPLLPLHLGLWTKYLIVLAGTFLITLGLYEGVIRRVTVLRICFGLKAREAKSTPQSPSNRFMSPTSAAALIVVSLARSLTPAQAASSSLTPLEIPAPSVVGNRLGISTVQPAVVYLPPSYHSSSNRYPVLYFLPNFNTPIWRYTAGAYQGFRLRAAADRLIQSGSIPEVIVVIPNGLQVLGTTWFRNSEVTGHWEDFLTRDLIGYIDRNYRTLREPRARAVAGHGVGGNAALEVALKHPDLFASVYALSPALMTDADLEEFMRAADLQAAAWQRLKETWSTLEPLAAQRAFRLYMQARMNSSRREDLFDALRISCAAAICKVTSDFPAIELPSPTKVDPQSRARFWSDILGNWKSKIAASRSLPAQLQSVTIEHGGKGEHDFILRGVNHVGQLMNASGIPATVIVSEGGHDASLGRRLENGMLVTLAKAINRH